MLAIRSEPNENDSISQSDEKKSLPPKMSTCAAVFKKLRKGKTIIHLSDDITIATLHAADITDPLWDSLADMAVGAVLLTVSLIELQETDEELEDLNEELKEINGKISDSKYEAVERQNLLEAQRKHLENQIYWTEFNKYLCVASVGLSATYAIDMGLNTGANVAARFGHELVLNQLGNAGLVIGVTSVPVVIMFLILMKQCIDLGILYDQRAAQIKIYNSEYSSEQEKAEAKEKIDEINPKIFYKKGEIFAQTLVTVSFLLSAIALSGLTFGAAPLALMIIGAAIGTLLKIHEIYTNTQRELKKQIKEKETTLDEKNYGKEVLYTTLQEAGETYDGLLAQKTAADLEIKRLRSTLEEKDKIIVSLKEQLDKSNQEKGKLYLHGESKNPHQKELVAAHEITQIKEPSSSYSPGLFRLKCVVPPTAYLDNATYQNNF